MNQNKNMAGANTANRVGTPTEESKTQTSLLRRRKKYIYLPARMSTILQPRTAVCCTPMARAWDLTDDATASRI
jgi:hypothetical protein